MAREIWGVLGHVNQVVMIIIFCIRPSLSSIFDCAFNRLPPFTIKIAKIIYFYINIKVNTNYISTKTLDINTLSHACYWHSCIKGILWQKLRRFKSQKREKGYFSSLDEHNLSRGWNVWCLNQMNGQMICKYNYYHLCFVF